MRTIISRIPVILSLCLLAFGILAAFRLQLAESNAYMGYQEFPLDAFYFGAAIFVLFVTGMLIPARISRPTDFFSVFYGLFVLLPFSVLYPIRGAVEVGAWSLAVGVLIFPLIAITILTGMIRLRRFPDLISEKTVLLLLGALCMLGLMLAFSRPTASAGFDLVNMYERRIEGRDVFVAGSLIAYLNAMVLNGLAPFFAFYSGWRKRYDLLLFAVACWVGYFYLLGIKSPLAYIVIGFLMGRAVRMGRLPHFARTVFYLVLLIFALFFVEFAAFGHSEVVGEYVIRRAFSVPPYLVSAYFEFIDATPRWSLVSGISTVSGITFEVGESFLGFQGLNANTNAFLYQFASGGLVMYLLTIILVAGVFAILDSAYRNKQSPVYLYLGFSYSVLVVEQSATTALVSSGVGLLLLTTIFMRVDNQLRSAAHLSNQSVA